MLAVLLVVLIIMFLKLRLSFFLSFFELIWFEGFHHLYCLFLYCSVWSFFLSFFLSLILFFSFVFPFSFFHSFFRNDLIRMLSSSLLPVFVLYGLSFFLSFFDFNFSLFLPFSFYLSFFDLTWLKINQFYLNWILFDWIFFFFFFFFWFGLNSVSFSFFNRNCVLWYIFILSLFVFSLIHLNDHFFIH